MNLTAESVVNGPPEGVHHTAKAVRGAWWDYVSLLAAHVAFAGSTIIVTVLLTRLLGPEGYGIVALFMAVIHLLFIVGVKWNLPAGKFGYPEPVGDTVAFLSSENASWIMGACINVDGGQSKNLF